MTKKENVSHGIFFVRQAKGNIQSTYHAFTTGERIRSAPITFTNSAGKSFTVLIFIDLYNVKMKNSIATTTFARPSSLRKTDAVDSVRIFKSVKLEIRKCAPF